MRGILISREWSDGIYYLGPEGSFSHQAASLLGGNLVPQSTISEIFKKVDEGESSLGVVPIENSLEGPVNETLDNLFQYDRLYVLYSVEIPVDLVLASRSEIGKVRRVYSHIQAIREAKNTLEKLGIKEFIPVESTSKAALMALRDVESAAICSRFAAKLYGLDVLYDKVQDGVNITKFVVISKKFYTHGERGIFMFTIPDQPGSLYRVLEKFYKWNVNLTMIYSRPIRSTPWHYYFYLEFENKVDLLSLEKEIRKVVLELKNKGTYKKLT
ncbi:MAG: prephenate dehydratase domain-containing protein [Candidatus Aramenus sulfurataquae]|jgi:prephenate dehydratase|uniref:ACT domain-containing protein n=2 Tax=Candidatus Aramenus sulfurataquae TaxID=1326980 RepID=A0A0F2LMR9_9CREN|nr:ACT domain-containing protein [Candidatus Aramenus sulfurataquae]